MVQKDTETIPAQRADCCGHTEKGKCMRRKYIDVGPKGFLEKLELTSKGRATFSRPQKEGRQREHAFSRHTDRRHSAIETWRH